VNDRIWASCATGPVYCKMQLSITQIAELSFPAIRGPNLGLNSAPSPPYGLDEEPRSNKVQRCGPKKPSHGASGSGPRPQVRFPWSCQDSGQDAAVHSFFIKKYRPLDSIRFLLFCIPAFNLDDFGSPFTTRPGELIQGQLRRNPVM
jgi:hypothetical protein